MSEKYEFIDGEYAAQAAANAADAPTIRQMCTWLSVAKSGCYEWRNRPMSATAQRRELLRQKIRQLFDDSDGTYGYRRIHAALAHAASGSARSWSAS